jgi:hypothetical protein
MWLVIVSNCKSGRVTRHRFDKRPVALDFADRHRARGGWRVEVQVSAPPRTGRANLLHPGGGPPAGLPR